MTNNAIEGFNNGLKAKYTEWDRLKLEDFITTLREIIEDNFDLSFISFFLF